MVGPTRTEPSTSARPSPIPDKPPRPPNAWILYRSHLHKELREQKLPQADVSRIISERWKAASSAERSFYEALAEQKSIEHKIKYPNYVFRPMKKEEKARQREEAKLLKKAHRENKGKAPPESTSTGFIPPASVPAPPTPAPPVAADAQASLVVRHGPFGPTPPLSAAPSPGGSSPSPVVQLMNLEHPVPTSYTQLPSQYSMGRQYQPSPLTVQPIQNVESANAPSTSKVVTRVVSGQWQSSQSQQLLTPVSATSPLPSNVSWLDVNKTEQVVTSTAIENTNPQVASDNAVFDLTHFAQMAESLFPPGSAGYEEASFQAMLSHTDDPAIFQLHGVGSSNITQEPQGPIEVVIGHLPFTFDESFMLPSDYDFGDFNMNSLNSSSLLSHENQQLSPLDNSSMYGQFYPVDGMLSNDPNNYNMMEEQFLTFGEDSSSLASNSVPPTPVVEYQPDMESAPAPYIPPAGAVHSSTRRVAGSWKPTFSAESPIDNSPPRAWSVQAS